LRGEEGRSGTMAFGVDTGISNDSEKEIQKREGPYRFKEEVRAGEEGKNAVLVQ